MSSLFNQLKKPVLWLLRRSLILYLALVFLLALGVNHRRVIVKTLNFLKGESLYLIDFAQGKTPFDQKAFLTSIRYYKNVVKLVPDSAAAYSALGFCYYHMGDPGKAVYYYLRAAELDQQLLGLHYNLGVIHSQLGRHEKAAEFFQKAIATDMKHNLFYENTVVPFHGGQSIHAASDGQRRIQLLKESYTKAYEMLVLSHLALQDDPGVLLAAERGISSAPLHKDFFYFHAGLAAQQMKDHQRAVLYLSRCVQVNPEHGEAYRYLGLSFEALKREDLAQNALRQAEKIAAQEESASSDNASTPLYYYPPVFKISDGQKRFTIM